jgi:hypothetical protein
MVKEALSYHNYVIQIERPSTFDGSAFTIEVVGMKCPRCKTQRAALEHGQQATCKHCGLHMELWGNTLQCEG